LLALLFTFGENLKTQRSQRTAAENAEKSLVTFEKRIPDLNESTVARFVARAKRAARVRGEVNVMITSSSELRRLNRRFRGKNKTTDVLSFPSTAIPANGLAGDVAISADIAADNARRLGHSMAEEINILALHGILHLAGYDHERDHGQMASREAHLRKAFRLPVGLIERNGKLLNAEHAEKSRRSWRKASVQRSSK
jgi:probable rRNA maturation factor